MIGFPLLLICFISMMELEFKTDPDAKEGQLLVKKQYWIQMGS